jgi:four helix bundle protein
MKLLDPEKLKVYDDALNFVVVAEKIAICTPRGHANLAEQLRRASTSIACNIAEGAGEFSRPEKARFYRIAKRSATESAGLVEIYRRLGFIDDELAGDARTRLVEIVSMLVAMITGTEDGAARKRSVGQGQA